MPTAISPYHYDTDFPNRLTLDNKIELFASRVQGWQIDPAHRLINSDMHSGFAVLHILVSYFESIAQFCSGTTSKAKSRQFFKIGFKEVFPPNNDLKVDPKTIDKMLDRLYDGVRCGLYHNSLTHAGIIISGEYEFTIAYRTDGLILINPHLLPQALRTHLHKYVSNLRNPSDEFDELRQHFENTYDRLSGDNISVKSGGT